MSCDFIYFPMEIIFPFSFHTMKLIIKIIFCFCIIKFLLLFLFWEIFFFSNTNICYMAQLYIIIYLNFIKKVNLNSGHCFIPLELRGGRALHNNFFSRSHVHNVFDLKVQ